MHANDFLGRSRFTASLRSIHGRVPARQRSHTHCFAVGNYVITCGTHGRSGRRVRKQQQYHDIRGRKQRCGRRDRKQQQQFDRRCGTHGQSRRRGQNNSNITTCGAANSCGADGATGNNSNSTSSTAVATTLYTGTPANSYTVLKLRDIIAILPSHNISLVDSAVLHRL